MDAGPLQCFAEVVTSSEGGSYQSQAFVWTKSGKTGGGLWKCLKLYQNKVFLTRQAFWQTECPTLGTFCTRQSGHFLAHDSDFNNAGRLPVPHPIRRPHVTSFVSLCCLQKEHTHCDSCLRPSSYYFVASKMCWPCRLNFKAIVSFRKLPACPPCRRATFPMPFGRLVSRIFVVAACCVLGAMVGFLFLKHTLAVLVSSMQFEVALRSLKIKPFF